MVQIVPPKLVLVPAGVTVKVIAVRLTRDDVNTLTGELVLVAKLKFGLLENTEGLSGVILSGTLVWLFSGYSPT